MLNRQIYLCLASLTLLGCSELVYDPAPVPIAKAPPIEVASNERSPANLGDAPTERVFSGVRFQVPAGWEEKPPSSTVLIAEFNLPGEAGAGRLTLSAAGGGTVQNLDRWKDQFRRGPDDPEPVESELSVAGKTAALIEAYGSFSDMFSKGAPKTNWQLLGVAIPVEGEHNYFVKLTGPREIVTARRAEFLKFVESARFEK